MLSGRACGGEGIRTPARVLPVSRFQNGSVRPLRHTSRVDPTCVTLTVLYRAPVFGRGNSPFAWSRPVPSQGIRVSGQQPRCWDLRRSHQLVRKPWCAPACSAGWFHRGPGGSFIAPDWCRWGWAGIAPGPRGVHTTPHSVAAPLPVSWSVTPRHELFTHRPAPPGSAGVGGFGEERPLGYQRARYGHRVHGNRPTGGRFGCCWVEPRRGLVTRARRACTAALFSLCARLDSNQ